MIKDYLKPGVSESSFWVTLIGGLVTTGTACLGLLSWEYATIILAILAPAWSWVRSYLQSKDKDNDSTPPTALLLLALMSVSLMSCAADAGHAVTYTSGDYVITISRQADNKSGVILPVGK